MLSLCSLVSHQPIIFFSLILDLLPLGSLSRFLMLSTERQSYSSILFRVQDSLICCLKLTYLVALFFWKKPINKEKIVFSISHQEDKTLIFLHSRDKKKQTNVVKPEQHIEEFNLLSRVSYKKQMYAFSLLNNLDPIKTNCTFTWKGMVDKTRYLLLLFKYF